LWPFNEEVVARAIAASPIPIISAVGHEVDVSICDLVADRRALTPSESGEIVVPDAAELLAELEQMERRLRLVLENRLETAGSRLDGLRDRPVLADPLRQLNQHRSQINEQSRRLTRAAETRLLRGDSALNRLAATLDALSPLKVLSRGYSITQSVDTGAVLTQAREVATGSLIETRLESGRLISRVEQVTN
jgi:exodeoxyribonuclease VII large subunit